MSHAFPQALAVFETAHREDPRPSPAGASTWSTFYHERMLHWLRRLDPAASEALQLAAASQHLRRWMIPRDRYPEGRAGYLRWRTDLGRFHAAEASKLLAARGYPPATIERVAALLQKKGLRTDPETQALEDAACLVFLENEFAAFSEKHDEAKIVDILKKTWSKMSAAGRERALELVPELPESARQRVLLAVSGS